MGCAHVDTDIIFGRESLADAIRQSEQGGEEGGPPFEWDIALHLGDLTGGMQPTGEEEGEGRLQVVEGRRLRRLSRPPDDPAGREVVRQFAASTQHRREDFYNLAGNHDASSPVEPCQWWFRKWVDPTGEQSETSGVEATRRNYPVHGTWERYHFSVGNVLFLMMSDRNDLGPPVGRASWGGGYPAGAVTEETFQWWRRLVEENRDSIIVSAHHHMLKETTVASGLWEGMVRDEDGRWVSHYHGYKEDGAPEGASYLYFVGNRPDAQAFETYLEHHPSAVDFWLGGHTHTHPDDQTGGRSHVERRWGANFVNVAALTRYHVALHSVPMSRLLTFSEGSDKVKVQCYLHTSQFAPQGWYGPAERIMPLSKPFRGH
jgi:hypothetical protein